MSSINVCTFSGRLGNDAETRYTANQKAITNFSLAVDIGWGENKKTMWVNCGIWGDWGEKTAPYLTKGAAVTVSGEIELREYESNGETRTSLSLTVRPGCCSIQSKIEKKTQYTGGFRDRSPTQEDKQRASQAYGGTPKGGPAQQGDFDDDLPF